MNIYELLTLGWADMRTSTYVLSLAVAFGVASGSTSVYAACSGAASPAALGTFNTSPADWLAANKGKGDIGAKAQSLAASAVNSNDPNFGKSLSTVLASASGDDGAAIGTALGGLVSTCSDPKDPGDLADKQYITSNIERNLLVNTAANTAYGQRGGPETAAAAASSSGGGGGAGGSSGSGTGQIGSGIPTGGVNSGIIPDGTTSTPSAFSALSSGSVPAISAISATSPGATTLAALTQSALNAAGSSSGSTFLLCYGTINICGNSGNVTVGVFGGGGTPVSTTSFR